MSLIYKPAGKAREYSPLALNIYNGCDFGCKYCYTTLISRNAHYNKNAKERKSFLKNLEKELSKTQYAEQIMLCFMCDPYCSADATLQTTRSALKILDNYQQKVAILTKAGEGCLRDIDIYSKFKDRIKVGATLSFNRDTDSLDIEPKAALPISRIQALKELHSAGIKTFVSIEPVIDPAQSIKLIQKTIPFVDQFKIGKINHFEKKFTRDINWTNFIENVVTILRSNKKAFYIKTDLAKFDTNSILTTKEKDFNYLNL